MERTVGFGSGAGARSRAACRANNREGKPETDGLRRVPKPIEMRLLEFDGWGRFDGCPGSHRSGHSCARAHGKRRVAGEGQNDREGETSGERPHVTGGPAHPTRA
jgi:hypothetical protein